MKKTKTAMQRFWQMVIPTNTCWIWNGALHLGYGQFNPDNIRPIAAYRFSYEQFKGPIPEGLHLDHLCRNRACVNPNHLEAVTQGVNVLRGIGPAAINAKKTHCAKGHEYTPENTISRDKKPHWRRCKICYRAAIDQRRNLANSGVSAK